MAWYDIFVSTLRGKTDTIPYASLQVSPADVNGVHGYTAATRQAALSNKYNFLRYGDGTPYSTTGLTETKDNSSTITVGANGLKFATASPATSTDDVTVTTLLTNTLAAGKIYNASLKLTLESAGNQAIALGFVTAGTAEVQSSNASDFFGIWKGRTGTSVIGRVVENGNTEVDSSSLGTISTSEVEIGLIACANTTAATSWGFWIYNNVFTPFSSAQCTALAAMLNTTAPSLAFHCGTRVNGTTQRTFSVSSVNGECQR